MIRRREFLISAGAGAGALAFGPSLWKRTMTAAAAAQVGPGPYGALLDPDANGVRLPSGFTSRVIARGSSPVDGTGYTMPIFPDGSSTFETPDGGWILAVNSEVPGAGGASGIRFSSSGAVTDAYRILEGTSTNCAGGRSPWGTWLSGEEVDDGYIWECDVTGATPAVRRDALGRFKHEAACVDPVEGRLYLTEDLGDGGLYRFTPTAYPDLSAGVLEIATVGRRQARDVDAGAGTRLGADADTPTGRGLDGVRPRRGHLVRRRRRLRRDDQRRHGPCLRRRQGDHLDPLPQGRHPRFPTRGRRQRHRLEVGRRLRLRGLLRQRPRCDGRLHDHPRGRGRAVREADRL